MLTVHDISKYQAAHPVAITIGTFDGVHVGHRSILEKVINHAKGAQLKSAVLTFFPHPRMVLQKDTDIKLLNTIAEKTAILEQMGLDILLVQPFTQEFSRLTATEFVSDVLVEQLRCKKVIIGYDHRFGRNRNADINDLMAFGERYDFKVEEIPAKEIKEVSVSSTKIRRALMEGDVQTANAYLGYAYMLSGTVQRGKGLGRKLQFPTANIHVPETYKLVPMNGAYLVSSELNGNPVHGMMNIGFNPTVDGKEKTIEVHFFDFEGDLYGQTVRVEFMGRLRGEKKFDSVEGLKKQLALDKEHCLELLGQR
ncbi:bifunctional riboflavin kinase/FAD synthetase [Maribacter sp. 2307ULW6-5]|uniref:bifunctional riboflavin kinase/FAD synthetase n=1 Tax=Maribacter sp. 2307ULW6-5 TaxID=3386275 RepID=UPI0039BC2E9D